MTTRSFAQQEIDNTLQKAYELYGYRYTPSVSFDNMGRCAGQAINRGGMHSIRLNKQLLCNEYLDQLIDTIRHEIAHLVCYFNPRLGKGHNAGWKRVAAALGAKPERCHQLPLKKARRTRKAVYDVNGTEIKLGITVHRRVQAGQRRILRATREVIKAEHFTGKVVMT